MEQIMLDMTTLSNIQSPITVEDDSDRLEVPKNLLSLETPLLTKTAEEIQELFSSYLKAQSGKSHYGEYSPIETKAIFLNDLIQMGNLGSIFDFCALFDASTLKQIVNAKPNHMYYGNVLHATLYSNVGESARKLYTYFRNCGAVPCLNYYRDMPWEQSGTIWTCIPTAKYLRNMEEFTETYQWAKAYELFQHKVATAKNFTHSSKFKTFSSPCHCNYHQELDCYSDELDYELDYDSVHESQSKPNELASE
jgi:hypothetical protein